MRYFTFLLVFTFISFSSQAKVWRVNNNEQVDADFATINEAVEVANPGDTIYVEGSATSYNNATINKTLTLIGTGYFLEENYPNEVYFDNLTASISSTSINEGAEGSTFIGLSLNRVFINTSDITLLRNLISQISLTGGILNTITDITINSSIITGRGSRSGIQIDTNVESIFISNNFISRGITLERLFGGEVFMNSDVVLISNNVFLSVYDDNHRGADGVIDIDNATIQNNIFLAGPINGNGNNIKNNISGGDIGTANGNLSNVDMATVFVVDPAEPSAEGISPDGRWQLAENSPAKGAGASGEDAGMFGGINAYVLSGLPPLPSIYEITSVTNTTVEEGLPVKVRIRVGN